MKCDRSRCAINEVELHRQRPGWLICGCGEEWRGSDEQLAEAYKEAGEFRVDVTGRNEPDGAALKRLQHDYARLAQKHRDALEYQEHFRRAGRPVPDVDLSCDPPLIRSRGLARPSDQVPQAQCPRCSEWVPDHDGFGVLAHHGSTYEKPCGYCSHPSRDGGICNICGDGRPEQRP